MSNENDFVERNLPELKQVLHYELSERFALDSTIEAEIQRIVVEILLFELQHFELDVGILIDDLDELRKKEKLVAE